MKKNTPIAIIFAAAGSAIGISNAAIVSADFTETLDLPSISSGPRILESLTTTIAAGFELDESDEISNPSSWNDSLQVDLTPSTLTLTPTGINTYGTITIDITNIVFSDIGEAITGFSVITDNAVAPDDASPILSTSFTANSLQVTYVSDTPGEFFQFPDGISTSTFAIQTSVPEPSSALLLGLCGVGIFARRRRA